MIEIAETPIGWYGIKVDGIWLFDKNGNYRRFKTEKAAQKAAKKLSVDNLN